ncbi:hypothetical protein CSTERTH_03520 [Thermoclostridium stercorarium subsp. thermolacticum DSM 2910]|uniref:Zinc-ribbon domain-containing protein n=1 Tax=Thermoclostridium stercorarium subsp. thermolacticum DSM 2910 TaxID=1121336 RepID=A0A1B1YBN3_THEST|nr:hypothetical protein [Thermoclostridium stercorarium]ANW98173.1 hypothetical protein CSTERTH_03520 [Thermoclostridium stercorarium subsp. thermolacticum DSM 2910]
MEKSKKNENDKLKDFRRYLEPCPHCGREILYHMTQCPFCKKEVNFKYYKPMDPEKAKTIKVILAIIGFIVVFVLLFYMNRS